MPGKIALVRSSPSTVALAVAIACTGPAIAQKTQNPSPVPENASVDASKAPAETTGAIPGDAATVNQSTSKAEEIVVTGTRLASGFAAPTPVTVLGSEAIQQRAPSTIAEALYELPTFNNNGPAFNNRGSTSVGFNTLDLRGIGAVRTLVLVDGRRYTPSNTTTTFDTNLIPSSLIARTEIVTGGASAAYGSDAISGVVNFILKSNLEGIEGTVQKGISQRGDNASTAINLAAGHTVGRLHLLFGLDYSKEEGVGYPGEGFYSRDWGTDEYGRLTLPATRAAGLPASILTSDVEYANKTPGSIITSGPLKGTAFGPGGIPYAFQYGSLVGTDQMTGSTANYNYSVTGRQPLATAVERIVTLGRATYDMTDSIQLYGEANYARSNGHSNTAEATIDNLIITRNNAYLPAATAAAMDAAGVSTITVGRLNEEPGPYMTHNVNTLKQGTVGAKGSLGGWKWDTYFSHGSNHYHLDVPNVTDIPNFRAATYAVRDASGNIVCGPVASNPNLTAAQRTQVEAGCVPFNVFGQGSPSQAAVNYTINYMFNDITAKQSVAAANLSGSPFSLWAGPISVAAGGEWRRNSARGTADDRSAINANFYGNYKPIDGHINVKEGYVEVGVPLARDLPFAKALDLNGAARVTDYSTSGTVTTWKAGLTYEPNNQIRFRVTRSRDIRAPNISDLFTQGAGGVFTGANPVTGASGQAQTVTRGNPTLTPEIADTWTAGLVLSPSFIPSLRFSVDYFNIKIKNVISTPAALDIVNQCYLQHVAASCASITVDPSTVLGFSTITVQPLNLNGFLAEGFDFELSYRVPIDAMKLPGTFNLRFLGTYNQHLRITDATGAVVGDQAGGGIAVQGFTGQPKWRWTVNATYNLDRFFTSVQVRGFTGIKYGINFIGPEDAGYNPALANSISKNRYPGAAYVNLALGYDVYRQGNRKVQMFANIDNLLDKDPPFAWIQDIATYDTIGRTFKVGVRFAY